jgi:hypothetical protein
LFTIYCNPIETQQIPLLEKERHFRSRAQVRSRQSVEQSDEFIQKRFSAAALHVQRNLLRYPEIGAAMTDEHKERRSTHVWPVRGLATIEQEKPTIN